MGSPTLGSANLESWTLESLDQYYIFVVFFGSPDFENMMILRVTFSLSYKTICLLKKNRRLFFVSIILRLSLSGDCMLPDVAFFLRLSYYENLKTFCLLRLSYPENFQSFEIVDNPLHGITHTLPTGCLDLTFMILTMAMKRILMRAQFP